MSDESVSKSGLMGLNPRLGFILSVFFFFVSSAVIWFAPLLSSGSDSKQKIHPYILGIIFWAGLLLGFVFVFLINRKRKKERDQRGTPLIWFFQNPIAIVLDILLILSTGGLLFVLFIKGMNRWVSAAITFTFVFSLEMHGMFNGENFKHIFRKNNQLGGK